MSKYVNQLTVDELVEMFTSTPLEFANHINEKFNFNVNTEGLSNHICGCSYKDFMTTYSIINFLITDASCTAEGMDINELVEKYSKKYEKIEQYLLSKLNTADAIMYGYSKGHRLGMSIDLSDNENSVNKILALVKSIQDEYIYSANKTYEEFIEKIVDINLEYFMANIKSMTTTELVTFSNRTFATNIPLELVGVNKFKDLYIIKEIVNIMFVCNVKEDIVQRIGKAGTIIFKNDIPSEERYLEDIEANSLEPLVDIVDEMYFTLRNQIRNNK